MGLITTLLVSLIVLGYGFGAFCVIMVISALIQMIERKK